jgi:hypothetical protein
MKITEVGIAVLFSLEADENLSEVLYDSRT